eukprot:TRINITY_DN1206_c0_g2_i3.p1 TRINITY_DN1206_c0_g2~~TRINITY_DN1206_c0_g2_i3.p1  ORF type:complete len:365 (-),score=115.14 TRINITY_DN1206_c0_g2_i3:129-1223(-)
MLKDVNAEIYALRSLADDKDAELARLKKDQAEYEESVVRERERTRQLEDDVRALRQGHWSAKKDVEALAVETEYLSSERAAMGSKVRDIEDEIVYLRQKTREEEERLDIARVARERRDAELAAMRQRKEVETWNIQNTRLENDNRELTQRIADIELQFMKLKRRCEDSSLMLESRARELTQLRTSLSYSPRRSADMYAELKMARENNEALQRMLDRYREDADFQERLCKIEAANKIELEAAKRKLESEALSKDLEARLAVRELEKVRSSRDVLLEGRSQVDEELNALKEHAEVLESQNAALNNELEKFVEIDERARRDLDRKYRVDYLKNKNSDQLQQSFERVRNATSPKRSPYSSPYRSPSKY